LSVPKRLLVPLPLMRAVPSTLSAPQAGIVRLPLTVKVLPEPTVSEPLPLRSPLMVSVPLICAPLPTDREDVPNRGSRATTRASLLVRLLIVSEP
jgi:hypothetical protein